MNTKTVQAAAKALLCSVIAAIILLFAVNAILLSFDDPNEFSGIAGLVILVLSSLIGGVAAGISSPNAGLLVSAMACGCYLLLHAAAGLIMGEAPSLGTAAVAYLASLAAALLGSVILRPRKKSSRSMRKFKKYSKKKRAGSL